MNLLRKLSFSLAFVLAALFVCAVCAWYLLRGREQKMARKSIAVASVFGLVFALLPHSRATARERSWPGCNR